MVGIEIGRIVQLKIGEAVIVVAPHLTENSIKDTPEYIDQKKAALDDLGCYFQQNLEEIKFSRGSAIDRDNLFMSSRQKVISLVKEIDRLGIRETEIVRHLKSCLQSADRPVESVIGTSIIGVTLETLDLAREAILNEAKK